MPKFSIIVPVYNVMPYLSQCVESIVNQNFQDYEIILVDDGSTDGSGDLCDALAEKYGKIQVVHKENGGLVSARKVGLLKASGDYVFNVDSDDYLDVNLLQNVDDVIKEYHPDVVAFDFYSVTEEGQILSTYANKEEEGLYTGEKLSEIRNRCIYDKTIKKLNTGSIANSLCTKVFRRSCVEAQLQAVPEEIVQGEDLAAVMPALCVCNSLYIYHYVGYYYRQRMDSVSKTVQEDEILKRQLLVSYLYEHTPGTDPENIKYYAYFTIVLYVYKVLKNAKTYSEFRNMLSRIQNISMVKEVFALDTNVFSVREKMRFLCLKHRVWSVFWLLRKKN